MQSPNGFTWFWTPIFYTHLLLFSKLVICFRLTWSVRSVYCMYACHLVFGPNVFFVSINSVCVCLSWKIGLFGNTCVNIATALPSSINLFSSSSSFALSSAECHLRVLSTFKFAFNAHQEELSSNQNSIGNKK